MNKIKIDFQKCRKPADIHERIADKLCFPAYYGKNFDALYDCLTDICEETRVVLCGLDRVKKRDFVKVLRQVFEDAEQSNRYLTVEFDPEDSSRASQEGGEADPTDEDYADWDD